LNHFKGTVQAMMDKKDERKCQVPICEQLGNICLRLLIKIIILDLTGVMGRNIDQLSGGELQRFAIAICCVQEADV
jgi:ATP-binding cassette subfamily E protein 1